MSTLPASHFSVRLCPHVTLRWPEPMKPTTFLLLDPMDQASPHPPCPHDHVWHSVHLFLLETLSPPWVGIWLLFPFSLFSGLFLEIGHTVTVHVSHRALLTPHIFPGDTHPEDVSCHLHTKERHLFLKSFLSEFQTCQSACQISTQHAQKWLHQHSITKSTFPAVFHSSGNLTYLPAPERNLNVFLPPSLPSASKKALTNLLSKHFWNLLTSLHPTNEAHSLSHRQLFSLLQELLPNPPYPTCLAPILLLSCSQKDLSNT